MDRLVIIRVGDPNSLWQRSNPLGLWSSPESHRQEVRNLFVEGYNVIALFVGRGDELICATRITGVRERNENDAVFPQSTDLGELKTVLQFDPNNILKLQDIFTISHISSINYIKYRVGSQHIIPDNISREFINYFVNLTDSINMQINTTYAILNNINYII